MAIAIKVLLIFGIKNTFLRGGEIFENLFMSLVE